jgi:hypothetical protein
MTLVLECESYLLTEMQFNMNFSYNARTDGCELCFDDHWFINSILQLQLEVILHYELNDTCTSVFLFTQLTLAANNPSAGQFTMFLCYLLWPNSK